jgi:hypothetical protein
MKRSTLKNIATDQLIGAAPDLAVKAIEAIISAPRVQAWFDGFEKRNPRGMVAWVRRLRGKQRGLTTAERRELSELLRREMENHR